MNQNFLWKRPVQFISFLLLTFCLFITANASPDFLTYDELTTLYEQEKLPQNLEEKLNRLLTTPFVNNSERPALSLLKSAQLGEFLRVAHWNIERGLEYDALEAAFSSPERFEALLDNERFPPGSKERSEILEQAAALRIADIIILNEVDWGVKRSDYRNIAADLAARLGMNYAFGVQFIELSPVHLSQEKTLTAAKGKDLPQVIKVDPALYKGLHGIAILSRFPLENVRLVPFKHQPYDWYKTEKKDASWLEKGKRKLSETVFLEKVLREVRRGGRTTLLADIVDQRLPSGRVTVVATHLENRTKAGNRVKQLQELLETIRRINNPVVVVGDMNTSSEDLTPTSLRRELIKRYGNLQYWIKQILQYALGFGFVEDFVMSAFTFGRTYADPTVRHIPFLSPNVARKFFTTLKKFRFSDGGAFDFRGEPLRSNNGKSKTLANSNERGSKGFITTFQVNRPISIVGRYKLDWIFIKPANLNNPTNYQASYQFAPHFGRTLFFVNEATKDRISDHRPLIVDLPLGEPLLTIKK